VATVLVENGGFGAQRCQFCLPLLAKPMAIFYPGDRKS